MGTEVASRGNGAGRGGPARGYKWADAEPKNLLAVKSGGARSSGDSGELLQHSFWLFDTEDDARAAETIFNSLRDMPEAPTIFISADVCEVVAQI